MGCESTAASPGGKRGRDPEEEVYLDNFHSQKRYLSEIMASSLNGLTVGDSMAEHLMDSPVRSESICYQRKMNKLRRFQQSLLCEEDDQEDDFLVESGGSWPLSPLQRLYAFAIFLVAGLAFMLLSLIVFARHIKFAVMFSFGNLLAIGSTAFLIGPAQQMRMMLDPVRIHATSIYIIAVIFALICALLIHSKVLTLISMVIEIFALIWYSLSYIPFARRMVSELLISCCDTDLS